MNAIEFIRESNRIEGIRRGPTPAEVKIHVTFWALERVTLADVEELVDVVAGAPLRREAGMDVRVGGHVPPPGGPMVEVQLRTMLEDLHPGEEFPPSPYKWHLAYEALHPFMDGNGRSGRALWAWQMLRNGEEPFALPFLHRWYYQSLDQSRQRDR